MLDDSDFELAAFVGPGGLIGLILLIVIFYFVSKNHDRCADMHCDHGQPVLMAHDCLCLDKAR